jgi:hypothetical protein
MVNWIATVQEDGEYCNISSYVKARIFIYLCITIIYLVQKILFESKIKNFVLDSVR